VSPHPDAILSLADNPAFAFKKATKDISVIVAVANSVELGLVSSLARPGGNIRGVCDPGVEIYGKMLEILKETVPSLTRVGVLISRVGWEYFQGPGLREVRIGSGCHSYPREKADEVDYRRAFQAFADAGVGAVS
jgi:putative tryptophan/tyrosine transport system substrate-binding protein